jgi:hypothetical protein
MTPGPHLLDNIGVDLIKMPQLFYVQRSEN